MSCSDNHRGLLTCCRNNAGCPSCFHSGHRPAGPCGPRGSHRERPCGCSPRQRKDSGGCPVAPGSLSWSAHCQIAKQLGSSTPSLPVGGRRCGGSGVIELLGLCSLQSPPGTWHVTSVCPMSLAAALDLSARSHHISLGTEVLLVRQHFPDTLLCAGLQSSKQDRSLSPQTSGLVMEETASWEVCPTRAIGAQVGVDCGKPDCSQAGGGALPEGLSWEQHTLYLFPWVFSWGAQTLCALTFQCGKRT